MRARETCEPEDIAVPQQGWLLDLWDEHGIEVPIVETRGGWVLRVSVQAYNDASDLAALRDALSES